MKVSYEEDLANHFGLPRRGGCGNATVLSVRAKGSIGQPLSSVITSSACRSCPDREKATSLLPLFGEAAADAAESETLRMCQHSKRENREVLLVSFSQRSVAP